MTSHASSEFLFNETNIEHIDNLDVSSDIKLEDNSENASSLIGNKRKLEVKSEPYQITDCDVFLNKEPKRKRIRLETTENIENTENTENTENAENVDNNNNNSNSNNSKVFEFPDLEIPDSTINAINSHHTQQYLLPIHPHPHPHHHPHPHPHPHHHPHHQYFVPVSVPHHLPPPPPPHHPHHINHYGHHPLSPFPHHINHQYLHHSPYNAYHHSLNSTTIPIKNELMNKQNGGMNKRRRRISNRNRRIKSDENDENDLFDDDEDINNNKLIADKSPFKTTYISHEEEIELKNTNNTLYSQFHHARQAIYQQYKQKVDAIRHSNILSQEKRKLNIKIAAIDAKVQEKKLFLSYLEMSKPQPNSWLISNTALSINGFARKITKQQQIPSVYSKEITTTTTTTTDDKKENNNNNNKKAAVTAKRVKKPKFSEYNVRVLRDWYETHTNNPYPSSSEKHLMCQLTGLTKYQVSRWFCNVRTRKPPPELSDNDADLINNNNNNNNDNNNNNNNNNDDITKEKDISISSTTTNRSAAYQQYYGHPYHHHPVSTTHFHPHLGISPLNLPPITPITPNHHFNFAPMNPINMNMNTPINIPPPPPPPITPMTTNNNNNNNNGTQENENMMIDNDNSEGLMPSINSNFNQPTNNLVPPPLIDENSNHMTNINDT